MDWALALLLGGWIAIEPFALVTHLGHGGYAARQKASQRLSLIGPRANPAIAWGKRHGDPEIRKRCESIEPIRPAKCPVCKGSGEHMGGICKMCYGWGTQRTIRGRYP